MPRGKKKAVGDASVSAGAGSALPLPEKWDGSPESKARLHRDAQRVLRAVASELGLGKEEFEVYSNELGPAIGGEIYFTTDTFRIWISGGYGRELWGSGESAQSAGLVESYITVRRCRDRKDYDYEHDLDLDWELLWDPVKLVEVLRLEGFLEPVT